MPLTDFQYPDVAIRLQEMFPSRVVEGNALDNASYALTRTITQNQGARPQGIFAGGICKGWEIHWLLDAAAAAATDGLPADCDVPGGPSTDSDKKTYDLNQRFYAARTVNDQQCTNRFTTSELIADAIRQIIKSLRKERATRTFAHVAANKQNNVYTGTYGDITDPLITKFTDTEFAEDRGAAILSHLRTTAKKNSLDRYIIIDDDNFADKLEAARFASCCGNEEFRDSINNFLLVQDFDLNQAIGGNTRNTLMINPEHIAYMNYHEYQNDSPVIRDRFQDGAAGSVADIFTWRIPDPQDTWKRWNEVDGSFTQAPIYYDFEWKVVCSGRDTRTGRRLYTHNIVGYEKDLLDHAPTNADGKTGILHFQRV